MENKQHVQLPNSQNSLEPKDLLVYLTIKRYMNKDTKEAFPSLMTISSVCGAAVNTVKKCINNLERENYIKIEKRGRSNVYKFLKYDNFEPFSYEFLDKKDLTFTEKAYLIASQQYMFKENQEGKISFTNKELSRRINLSESAISKANKSLEKKDYLSIIQTNKIDPITGLKIREKFFHLNKLQQAIVFVLQNHEERINENTSAIKSLQKDMEILMRENKKLKEQINKQNSEINID